ncbi:MAG: chemotaxis protein CheW [Planctomycetaceae bacterium]|nr:chemotaxis protein CheW [Planctomycetaceae bacterium]
MAVEADLLQEFLAESWENLGLLDTEIVRLEQEPGDAELIASIFRTIHTLKGTCGFLGLSRLGEVAHSTENVLGKMRDRCLDVCPSAISIVLEGVDRIKDLLRGLEETGEEPVLDSRDLLHRLELLSSLAAPPRADRTLVPPAVAPVSPPTPVPAPVEREIEPAASAMPRETATVAEKPDAVADTPVAKPVDRPKVPASVDEAKSGVADLSIRVNVNVLDRLMNLVGELVLTRNQLLQMVRGDDESRFSAPIAMLNHVTTDLQEGVMKTRMQPIGNAWNKLPRLVRDLCQITGKQIELEMQGAETELDRTVLDAIKDPLTHMVRNSADHGIESPEIRRQRGKSEIGRIQLHAFHEGGHVIIRISDDGSGINRGRVLRKAIENGIVSEAESAQMSDSEILRLIFRAGFSTAEAVTSISGRGVGMDVVRTEIERIGGTIELSSQEGSGTTVRIRIPLTLAIVSALVVESGGQTFAIPQLAIVELVRLSAEDRQKIERVHDREVYRLRDRLLPLVSLTNVLNLEEPPGASEEDTNIVVVQVGEEQFGLIVSEVFDTQEIVVKPVGQLLKDIKVYQGTTILGDGRVIMILDVSGIAATFGGLSSELKARGDTDEGREDDDRVPLLLFRSGSDIYAVPLGLVSRLEEFPTKEIERSGDRLLVKYRGNLLQLVPIGGESGGLTASGMQQVVVFSEGQRSLGLMAEEIVDIVEEPLRIHMPSTRRGTLGTALVGGHATEVLDTQSYLMQADPQWFRPRADKPPRVLIADRSIFFRNLVKSILEADGYRAITVETTAAAIERLSHDGDFEAIVGEVLPPDSAGITLPEWVRGHDRFRRAVVLGLAAEQNQSPSLQTLAGEFDRVIVKFDAAQFRAVLRELMSARGLSGECA